MTALRVAPHVHSTWSYDGHWTLEALARAFADKGFHAVLMAEHDRTFDQDRWLEYREACAAASGHGALLVPGIEYSDAANRVHVPVWGAEDFLGSARPTRELLLDARAADGVAMLAHPARRDAWRGLDAACLELAAGVEVWNRKYDGWAPSSLALELAERHGLTPFVGLDFHTRRQFFPLAMAGEAPRSLTPQTVIDALRAGDLRPTVLGQPLARFMHGGGLRAAGAAEVVRRGLARTLRRGKRVVGRLRA